MEDTNNLCGASPTITPGNYFSSKHGSRKKAVWEESFELNPHSSCMPLVFLDTMSKTFAKNSNSSKNKIPKFNSKGKNKKNLLSTDQNSISLVKPEATTKSKNLASSKTVLATR